MAHFNNQHLIRFGTGSGRRPDGHNSLTLTPFIWSYSVSFINTHTIHLVQPVDDALMGITHVIRAEEHLTNTLRQCLILEALKYPQVRLFLIYA